MEDGGLGVRINRQSSIESEPRTLTFDQIHYAREAALYVVKTRNVEEALSVFTEKKIGCKVFVNRLTEDKISGVLHYQGSEPVDSVAPKGGSTMHLDGEINSIRPQLIKLPAELRDVVSAPF